MFRAILVLAACLLASMASTSRAAIILSDSFTYPDGALQTVSSNKWVGHSGTTNQVDVSSGGLNLTGAETQDVNALLIGQPYASGSGHVLYAAFDLKITSLPSRTGSYFAHFKDAADGYRGRIWVLTNGAASGRFRVGVSSGSGTAAAAVLNTDLQAGVSYRVVCSLVVSNAVTTLWINPKSESDTRITTEPGGGISIAAFAFRQATGIGTLVVDNLAIGTAFRDVVPNAESGLPPASPEAVPVTVPPPPLASPIVIALQPESQTASAGQDIVFKAQAQGVEPMFYQWQFNQADIPGATNQLLALSRVAVAQQGDYRLVVKNATGLATSAAAKLTVLGPQPPQITSQPISLTLNQGQTAHFFVAASGNAPLRYQWRFNGSEVSGAAASTLTLTNAQPRNSGKYSVVVSNEGGSVESESAELRVNSTAQEVLPTDSKPPIVQFTNYLARLKRPGDLLKNRFTEHALRPGETLEMRVAVASSDGQKVTLSVDASGLTDSTRWTIPGTAGTNLSAILRFAPIAHEAGSNFFFNLHAVVGGLTNTSQWSVYVPTAQEQQIVVSEFLPNPATTNTAPHFNPLRRAEPPPNPAWHDEFVELVNDSDQAIDLSRWTISDSLQVRHRFSEQFTLQGHGAIVIYGGPRSGFPPMIGAPAIWASDGSTGLGLNNTGNDVVMLRNAQGRLISRVAYSGASTNSSLTRYPTLNDGFVTHASIAANYVSPGVHYDGRKFSETALLPLAPIQLAGALNHDLRVVLTWNAERGRSYSVLHSTNLAAQFFPIAKDLRFDDRSGRIEAQIKDRDSMGFYRISSP